MAFKIPDGMSMEEASVVGCRVTTAYNAVKHRGRLAPGESALVIGCGGIGLNTIQFLKCFGAYPIIAVDIADDKLEAAKQFGATHTINASAEDPVKAMIKLTDGGVDKVVRSDRQSEDVRSDHSSHPAGRHGDDHRRLGQRAVHDQQRQFRHPRDHDHRRVEPAANDVEEVFQMAQLGRIELKNLITKSYRYDQLNEALADLEHGKLRMAVSLWN